jgi:hypothetical protein
MGPATKALGPALTALAIAPAIQPCDGLSLRQPQNKLDYLCILTISTFIRLLNNACVGWEIRP